MTERGHGSGLPGPATPNPNPLTRLEQHPNMFTNNNTPALFRTISDVKATHRNAGGHFFDPMTVRYFGSRVGSTIYGGALFVTTELDWNNTDRRATVRLALPNGDIEQVGAFRHFPDARTANRAARQLAAYVPALLALHALPWDGRQATVRDLLAQELADGWRPAAGDLLAVAHGPVLAFIWDRIEEGLSVRDAFAVGVRVASLAVAPA